MAFGNGFWNAYPGTNLHEIDLHYVIMQMLQLRKDMQEFINDQSITFADPIEWNITNQYKAHTIVMDSQGNGYISIQAVPAGTALSNTDYWQQIFNFGTTTDKIRGSIAVNAGSSATTPVALTTGQLVWWQDDIYKVITDMAAGTAFITGTNIERYTVDEKITDGDAALDEKITDGDAALAALIQNNTDALQSIRQIFYNVVDYGATGDGITDNRAAIQAALDAAYTSGGGYVFLPPGDFAVNDFVVVPSNVVFFGAGESSYIHFTTVTPKMGVTVLTAGSNCRVSNMKIGYYDGIGALGYGSMWGAAAVGNYKYENVKNDDLSVFVSEYHDIEIDHIYTDGLYCLQTEPTNGTIRNVYYHDINTPNACVSFQAGTQDGIIKNAKAERITCAFFRTVGAGSMHNTFVNDLTARYINLASHDIYLNNITIDQRGNNPWDNAGNRDRLDAAALWIASGGRYLEEMGILDVSNMKIVGGVSLRAFQFATSELSGANFVNLKTEGEFAQNSGGSVAIPMKWVNCDLAGISNVTGMMAASTINYGVPDYVDDPSNIIPVPFTRMNGAVPASDQMPITITKTGKTVKLSGAISVSAGLELATEYINITSDTNRPSTKQMIQGIAASPADRLPVAITIDTDGSVSITDHEIINKLPTGATILEFFGTYHI